MGTAAEQLSTQHVINLVRGTHGAAADGTPHVILIGGKFVAAPTAVSGAQTVVMWLDERGYSKPHVEARQLDGFTTASANGTGTSLTGLGAFTEMDILIDVTLADGTTPTLDLLLDTQYDGTGWVNLAKTTQITTIDQVALHLTRRLANTEVTNVDTTAGAGTLRNLGWGDALRVRRIIAGTSPSFSGRIWISAVG